MRDQVIEENGDPDVHAFYCSSKNDAIRC